MMIYSKQTLKNIFLYSIIVVAGILLTLFLLNRNAVSKLSFEKNSFHNDNDNISILNQLNDDWKLPKDFTFEAIELDGMKMNWIYADGTSTDKVILQLHGGAYQKSLEENGITYQRSAVKYAKISNAKVLTIDYRVAPEDPYPAALEDSVTAYLWLLEKGYQSNNIIIAGDSAGGGLTLATTLYLRDYNHPLPAALITMSPWTNLNYKRLRVPYIGDHDATDPYISPIYGEYTDFPPMLMQVGGDEVLLADTTSVAKNAQSIGVEVNMTIYDGMFHVFQMLYPALEDANSAWDEVAAFIHTIF